MKDIIVRSATTADSPYVNIITAEMAESAKARGTGIARRSDSYVERKMIDGNAVIALTKNGDWVGFCYIESWQHEKFVVNSGLIVSPAYRKSGVAKEIKKMVFNLSKIKYPHAKIFGLTTALAVMRINSDLGYVPVTYGELTTDDAFWKGCESCVNFETLQRNKRKNCMCTAMLYEPGVSVKTKDQVVTVVTSKGDIHHKRKRTFKGNFKLFERWVRFKKYVLLRAKRKKEALKK